MSTAPSSLSKALIGPEAAEWRVAIVKECASMESNQVWVKVVDTGQPRIPSSVIFRRKGDGTTKARIVAGGHKEISGLHFDPDAISSPVLKSISFRLIFLKGIELGLMIYHIYVVTAYLNSPSKHVIYMTLPPQLGEFGIAVTAEQQFTAAAVLTAATAEQRSMSTIDESSTSLDESFNISSSAVCRTVEKSRKDIR